MFQCLWAIGQTPSFYTIGEIELSNTDIYSILETNEGQLLIATDNGLYIYENGKTTSIPSPIAQKGQSLFNLIKNKSGEVFCCNLTGQIFQYENNKLSLFFEVPKEHLSSITIMSFDNNGDILFASKGFYKIANHTIKKLFENSTEYSLINVLPNDIIIGSTEHQDSLLHIENGQVQFEKIYDAQKDNYLSFPFYQVVGIKGQLIRCFEGGFYSLNTGKDFQSISKVTGEKYHQFNTHEFWGRHPTKGVRLFQAQGDSIRLSGTYFQDKFISAIEQGKNGTMYFGTFGHGIIILPNRNILNHNLKINTKQINSIAVSEDNDVFISENGVGIRHYQSKTTLIENDSLGNYKRIFYTPKTDYEISTQFPSLFFTKDILYHDVFSLQSVKDIHRINDSVLLFATSSGLKGRGMHHVVDFVSKDGLDYKDLKFFGTRCRSVTFDSIHKDIYVATSSSLMMVNNEGDVQELTHQNQSIQCNDLIYHNNSIWCATQNFGILVFEKGQFTSQISTKDGLLSNIVRKIQINHNLIYLMSSTKFQIVDLSSFKVRTIGIGEGLAGYVTDFAISKDQLWLVTDNANLISIKVDSLPLNVPELVLTLDAILVNDSNYTSYDLASLSYLENQFEFNFHLNNLVYQQESQVFYRIVGFEEEWNRAEVFNGIITYNSLPPGKYQFECYVQYGNHQSNILTKAFTINNPYWQTWWFYALLAIAFSSTIIIIAIYRIKRLKKNNQEKMEKQILETNLLDLELKALRSQMNPHFIFNSLNAIQDLVLQQKTDVCYDYIVLFANLVRNALNYSNVDFIPVDKEIEFLYVYLKLEKLRFGDEFNYEINFEGDQEIEVPSLVIQPFIENAILHGLLHKEGPKYVKIDFIHSNNELQCIITDNGIGRNESKEIQDRQGDKHESFAMDAIKKRLSILSEKSAIPSGFEIIDLIDEEKPAGTKVEIKLPFKSMF